MFTADKLNGEIAKEKWDTVKIMCTQPFNKNFKYGLSFISIYSVEEKPATLTPATTKNGEYHRWDNESLLSKDLWRNGRSTQNFATFPNPIANLDFHMKTEPDQSWVSK